MTAKWEHQSQHPTFSSSLSFLLLVFGPLFPLVCPIIHAAMQICLLCRQNCRGALLPVPLLVLSIHLRVSCGADPVSAVLRNPAAGHFSGPELFDSAGWFICMCSSVCVLFSSLNTTLTSLLFFFPSFPLWLCRCLEGYRYSEHKHSRRILQHWEWTCADQKYLIIAGYSALVSIYEGVHINWPHAKPPLFRSNLYWIQS